MARLDSATLGDVFCATCGFEIPAGGPDVDQIRCPRCGSTERSLELAFDGALGTIFSLIFGAVIALLLGLASEWWIGVLVGVVAAVASRSCLRRAA